MLNLSVVLDDAARETPDHEAVVFGDLRLSYGTVNTIANQSMAHPAAGTHERNANGTQAVSSAPSPVTVAR